MKKFYIRKVGRRIEAIKNCLKAYPLFITMKRISIYNNYGHNHKHKRNRLTKLLREKGFTPISNGELVIVIGGDGTFLSAVKERMKDDPVFVALNDGNLGFFSEFDFKDAKKFVDMLTKKEYRIIEYPLYEVEIIRKNSLSIKEYFINDVAIEKKSSKMIHLKASIDNQTHFNYASDGLIVSSSIGSTAYSMNVGGAITPYHFPSFQLSPIVQSRYGVYEGLLNPLLLKDESVIEIMPDYKVKRAFRVSVDGKEIIIKTHKNEQNHIHSVRISKSNKTFKVLRSNEFNEMKHMKSKLF